MINEKEIVINSNNEMQINHVYEENDILKSQLKELNDKYNKSNSEFNLK
jgi:hypothetical protein